MSIRFKILVSINIFLVIHGLPPTHECGKSLNTPEADWRIVGGTDVTVGEFPWQVLLTLAKVNKEYDSFSFCGGTLINERWVLTAGHCILNGTEESLKVRLGVHNLTINESDKEVDIFVEKLVLHEQWVGIPSISNDIALIKLNVSLDFRGKHKHLSPICLARSDTKLTKKCIVTGFGYINDHGKRPVSGILQKVDEPLTQNSICEKIFHQFNETQEICAGGSQTGGFGVCNCDSGGPLQCQADDGRWYQVGVVSFGKPCAWPNTPDVFTKVSAYIDWIEKTVSTH